MKFVNAGRFEIIILEDPASYYINNYDEYRSNAECMKCNNISRRIFEKYIDTDREYQGFYYTHKKILI